MAVVYINMSILYKYIFTHNEYKFILNNYYSVHHIILVYAFPKELFCFHQSKIESVNNKNLKKYIQH